MDELDGLLVRLESGALGDPLPLVAYLAGRGLELPPEELNAARRRAILLRATGGDPRRELDVDDRGVRALALDLLSPARQAALAAGLDALVPRVRDLPLLRGAVVFLAGELDLAWRLYALGLLAEELEQAGELEQTEFEQTELEQTELEQTELEQTE